MTARAYLLAGALLASLVALGVVMYRLNAGRAAEARLARLEGAAEVQADVDELVARNALLEAALADAGREHRGSLPVFTLEATARVKAHGEPRPPDPPGAPAAPTLVSEGDEIDAKVTAVGLEPRDGKTFVVGTVDVIRVTPTRGSVGSAIFEKEIQLPTPGPPPARWGAGLAGFLGPSGGALGVALSPPTVRLGPVDFDATVALGKGEAGMHGFTSIVVRF